jgi:poly(3-hydroxybutyrate) depolymerase
MTSFRRCAMIPDRSSFVPMIFGSILLAAGAADGHELMRWARDDDWWLFVRTELEFLGGLWFLGGISPRWARISATTAFVGILACDLARAIAGYPARDGFGRVAVGHGWVLISDLIIVFALLRWRPAAGRVARVESRPGRVAGTALLVAAIGIAIDWSQVGRFPGVATAPSGQSSSSPALDYLVYLPSGYYRFSGRWPLILYLHGSGEVGHDINRLRAGGLLRRIEAGWRNPFIIVGPHSPGQGWDVAALDSLLDEVMRRYRVDADRVYLTGVSMGGYGTWALASAYPERFAAIAPICGGGDPASADRLRGVPTWAFHGAEDTIVPAEESRRMVAALEQAGGDVRLTVYPGVGHNSGAMTYADNRLYDWFLAHRRRADDTDVKAPSTATPAP